MTKFDHLVIVGASWSWGAELPEDLRESIRFEKHLAQDLKLPSTNLSREGATNFCYKWHWINWLNSNPTCQHPLVFVQVTLPNRHLIYNNSANFFQESPDRLVSEKMVAENWPNSPMSGGFMRVRGNEMDFPDPIKEQCGANFYRYNYDDKMGEIYTLWEIKLLDMMIKESGGRPVFWTDEWSYNVNLPWAKDLLKNCILINQLQPFCVKPEYLSKSNTHPNEQGHRLISAHLQGFSSQVDQ